MHRCITANFAGILFILGHESYTKYIVPARGLYRFLGGGGSLPLRYAKSTKILFALNVHKTRQRKKPSIVYYDTSN